jgi:hypothetical protein
LTISQTASYPGNWLYETWSESELKEWLDTHGIPGKLPYLNLAAGPVVLTQIQQHHSQQQETSLLQQFVGILASPV